MNSAAQIQPPAAGEAAHSEALIGTDLVAQMSAGTRGATIYAGRHHQHAVARIENLLGDLPNPAYDAAIRACNSHAALVAFANAFHCSGGLLIPNSETAGRLEELHRAALEQVRKGGAS
jgi:hypothetical protein